MLHNEYHRERTGFFGFFNNVSASDILGSVGCKSGVNNVAHFCSPRIDAEVAQLSKQQPSPASTRLAAKIDREIVDQAPWVPLFTPRFASLASRRLGNYQASTYGSPLFDQMWVK